MTTIDDLDAAVRARSLLKSGHGRRARERLGVSQAALARAMGCSESLICRYENLQRIPSTAMGRRYVEVLDRLAATALTTKGGGR